MEKDWSIEGVTPNLESPPGQELDTAQAQMPTHEENAPGEPEVWLPVEYLANQHRVPDSVIRDALQDSGANEIIDGETVENDSRPALEGFTDAADEPTE